MMNRILLVEDSPTQLLRAKLLLEDAGYQIETAENGRDGLEKARVNPPDLVVTDIIMPEMDGYEMTRCLKEYPATSPVPVLMVTTRDQPQDVIRGLEVGADHFIPKPYEDDYLVQRVQALFDWQRKSLTGELPVPQELHHLSQKIVITQTREQILKTLLTVTSRVIDCEAMALLPRSPREQRTFFVVSFYPVEASTLKGMESRVLDILVNLGISYQDGAPTGAVQVVSHPAGDSPIDTDDLLTSCLHVPLITDRETTGIFSVFSSKPEAFDIQHVRFVFEIGQKGAQALSRVRAA